MVREYGTVKHPKSGETYAVMVIDGAIKAAAGPLHHSDPTDSGSIIQWIMNAEDAKADGEWLAAAIAEAKGE